MVDIKVEGPKMPVPPKKNNERVPTIQEKRFDAVQGIWQLAGLGCVMMRQYADAGAISMHSPAITKEVVELANNNEVIANAVDQLLQVGPYAGLVAAVMPLAAQLLVNHGRIPADKMPAESGIVDPKILEAQVKTEMMRMQLEALKAQREAELDLARMQAEFEEMENDNTE